MYEDDFWDKMKQITSNIS